MGTSCFFPMEPNVVCAAELLFIFVEPLLVGGLRGVEPLAMLPTGTNGYIVLGISIQWV